MRRGADRQSAFLQRVRDSRSLSGREMITREAQDQTPVQIPAESHKSPAELRRAFPQRRTLMKKIFVVVLLASCLALPAQETRHEVSHATGNPSFDSKPNSPDGPHGFGVSGHLQRIVVLRFKFGADLLAGLEKMIAQEKIK